jgi:hypothetical protein
MITERVKAIQQDPASATDSEVKALAYLFPLTMDTLMLRNQQIRLLKDRMKDILDRSLKCQRARLISKSHLLFWQAVALIASFGLFLELL